MSEISFSAAPNTPSVDHAIPPVIADWFASRGWKPRRFQLEVAQVVRNGASCLLVAPTGGGKTLAGFMPALIELLSGAGRHGLHTLYVSPLKAIAVDVRRNLEIPVHEMGLDVRLETRTGDTSGSQRSRQRRNPPDILFTTPESLAVLLSYPDSPAMFRDLRFVIVDELHALAGNRRGDQLALNLSRLSRLAPEHRCIGLTATVADPASLERFLGGTGTVERVVAESPALPDISILTPEVARVPWAGHSALHAVGDIYRILCAARTALVFVNTRSQAERIFHALWNMNERGLDIALHHGSLAVDLRRKVESAMAAGDLDVVVCTSTLDLGVDWGAVDLVIQIGAPKGIARMLQRIGRANHRLDEPSRAILVPSNRFELLECQAVLSAVQDGVLDGSTEGPGGLEVLAQHVLLRAATSPFDPDELYDEIRLAAPYALLARATFDRVIDCVATGGFALRAYDRFKRLYPANSGCLRIANEKTAHQARMNAGTIVEDPMLCVRQRSGKVLGEIEENFVNGLRTGDTFAFGGKIWKLVGIRNLDVLVVPSDTDEPKVPVYGGGSFPPTTNVADYMRRILVTAPAQRGLPDYVRQWLLMQEVRSVLPEADELLIECFPRGNRHFTVLYPFEGRPAHQTLGMLMARRMETNRLKPLGFMCNDYALAIWSLAEVGNPVDLLREDLLDDDLEDWIAGSVLLKRAFRKVATIAGLLERRHPGKRKSGRQVTFSSDLMYDVLRRYEPDHVILGAARHEASRTLLDTDRLEEMLKRITGRIVVSRLESVSPLAFPIMLEVGRQLVGRDAVESLLDDVEALTAETGLSALT